MRAKVTIYAKPDGMVFAAQAAERVLSPDYVWPADGVAVFGYPNASGTGFVATHAIKRNKAGITVWEQGNDPLHRTAQRSRSPAAFRGRCRSMDRP